MLSVVLAAAMATGEMGAHQHYHVSPPCECCLESLLPRGGVVVFFWQGPAGLSDAEEKEWKEYVNALDIEDRPDVERIWSVADRADKQALLKQVREMRAKKDQPKKPETDPELKKPTPEPKKPEPKKPEPKKPEPKKAEPKKPAPPVKAPSA